MPASRGHQAIRKEREVLQPVGGQAGGGGEQGSSAVTKEERETNLEGKIKSEHSNLPPIADDDLGDAVINSPTRGEATSAVNWLPIAAIILVFVIGLSIAAVFVLRPNVLEPQIDRIQSWLEEGNGAVIYMSGHEGRGIGLWAKAVTYLLQDDGQDTFEANVSLGLPEDSRDFTDAAVVLRYLLSQHSIRLLSNNPHKRAHLEQGGQTVSATVPLVSGICEHNVRYLRSKRKKGHALPDEM